MFKWFFDRFHLERTECESLKSRFKWLVSNENHLKRCPYDQDMGGAFQIPIFSAYVRTSIFPCWFFEKLHPRNLASDCISKPYFLLLWSIMLIVKTFEENITFWIQNHRFFHLRAYVFILLSFSAYGRAYFKTTDFFTSQFSKFALSDFCGMQMT